MNIYQSNKTISIIENATQLLLSPEQRKYAVSTLREIPTGTELAEIIQKLKTISSLLVFALIAEQVLLS